MPTTFRTHDRVSIAPDYVQATILQVWENPQDEVRLLVKLDSGARFMVDGDYAKPIKAERVPAGNIMPFPFHRNMAEVIATETTGPEAA